MKFPSSSATIFSWVLVLLTLCVAPAQGQREAPPSPMDLLDNERRLSVGDRLIYEVVEERDAPIAVFVDDQGFVRLPLIGKVPAAGKTTRELAYDAKTELEKDFFHQATVLFRYQYADGARGRVTLVGQVRQPGPMPIPADQILTVSGAILRAGGLDTTADGRKVALVRRDPANPDDERRFELDVRAMLETGDFSKDMPVQADDLIVVPRGQSLEGQVYIVGAVARPGLYDIPPGGDFTVSKAIMRAGDFTRFADKRRVKLIRGDESLPESERTIIVNVADVLERGRRQHDPEVQPDDIIRVEERTIVF